MQTPTAGLPSQAWDNPSIRTRNNAHQQKKSLHPSVMTFFKKGGEGKLELVLANDKIRKSPICNLQYNNRF